MTYFIIQEMNICLKGTLPFICLLLMNHALSHATPSFFPAILCKTLPFSLLRSLLSLPLLLVPVFSRQAVSCLQFVSRSRAYQISTGHTPIQNCRRSRNLHCLAKEGELKTAKCSHSALPCLHFVPVNISILSLSSLWTNFFYRLAHTLTSK